MANCARQLLLAQVIRDSFGCKPVINKREHETVQMNNVAQTESALDDNLGEKSIERKINLKEG